jgi:hypothetical protein
MAKMLRWRIISDNSSISRAIQFVSRGDVCHIGFISRDGRFELGARSDGGVQYRPLDKAKREYRFEAEVEDEKFWNGWGWLDEQVGKKYDYGDILSIMLNRDWHDTSRWICSELWIDAMEQFGLTNRIDSSIANRFTPQDGFLLSLAKFKQINFPSLP